MRLPVGTRDDTCEERELHEWLGNTWRETHSVAEGRLGRGRLAARPL